MSNYSGVIHLGAPRTDVLDCETGAATHDLCDGFTWTSKDMDETQSLARHGWDMAKQMILAAEHDILILDEFTYPLHFGWIDTQDVLDWLDTHKPPMMHIIITGRNAPQSLIDFAELVTEMREIKHPFSEQGVRAQAGIEF